MRIEHELNCTGLAFASGDSHNDYGDDYGNEEDGEEDMTDPEHNPPIIAPNNDDGKRTVTKPQKLQLASEVTPLMSTSSKDMS